MPPRGQVPSGSPLSCGRPVSGSGPGSSSRCTPGTSRAPGAPVSFAGARAPSGFSGGGNRAVARIVAKPSRVLHGASPPTPQPPGQPPVPRQSLVRRPSRESPAPFRSTGAFVTSNPMPTTSTGTQGPRRRQRPRATHARSYIGARRQTISGADVPPARMAKTVTELVGPIVSANLATISAPDRSARSSTHGSARRQICRRRRHSSPSSSGDRLLATVGHRERDGGW
jgi:hypothetical protein